MLGRLRLQKCARFVGQVGAGRMDALAVRLEHPRHRILREPVDLAARAPARAARARWRRRAARGRARSATRRTALACGGTSRARHVFRGRGRSAPSAFELSEQLVDPSTGSRAFGDVAPPPRSARARRRWSRRPGRRPRAGGRDPRRRGSTRLGQETRATSPQSSAPRPQSRPRRAGGGERRGVDVQAPPTRVLDLLRRVRLGEDLREEEPEELHVVGPRASNGGCTLPSPGVLERARGSLRPPVLAAAASRAGPYGPR